MHCQSSILDSLYPTEDTKIEMLKAKVAYTSKKLILVNSFSFATLAQTTFLSYVMNECFCETMFALILRANKRGIRLALVEIGPVDSKVTISDEVN